LETVDATSIMKSLVYTEAVLLEVLRLHPSVSQNSKVALRDCKLPNRDFTVYKGDRVVWVPYVASHMDWNWENALKFDPQRFLVKDGDVLKVKKFPDSVYHAFNIKPRVCLGKHVALMEAKLALVKFFQRFTYKVLNEPKILFSQIAQVDKLNCDIQLKMK